MFRYSLEPQAWYLDLFAGKNDYEAADKGGPGGHKEINRTTLTTRDIEQGLTRIVVRDQLEIIRPRNKSRAIGGELTVISADEHCLHLTWEHHRCAATTNTDLRDFTFNIMRKENNGDEEVMSYR